MYASSDFSPPQNAFEIESAPEREKWCLDSGCSSHLCRDTRDFSEISNVANGTLNLATKASTEIKARGTVLFTGDVNGITKRVSVKDTLHVPELRTNLLSVGKITDRGYKVIFDKSCRDWFRRFKNNDFELEDKERSGAPKKFQDKELEQLLDEDPSQTLPELGKILQVDESTVSKRLKGLGMIQKQGHWVPYELKPRDVERRFGTCELLLQRQKRKGFLPGGISRV
ncbi:MOS1T transposase, partial [Pseudoatta argentina]